LEVQDIGSGASLRPKREGQIKEARRRELGRIVMWRLDLWARSLADLVCTLQELASLNVGFVSLSEALDLTPRAGAPSPECLRCFAEFEWKCLRDRVKATDNGGADGVQERWW
jgi:putative DNA-invertase from lambdoid prophage Rac